MKKFVKFNIKGLDGKIIQAYKLEAVKPIATFHLVHGLSEYVERYEHFANFLFDNNISVYSLDNRGYGKTIDKPKNIGLVEKGDIQQIVNDHIILSKFIKNNSSKPSIIMGHSFGSYVVQKYIQEYHDDNLIILSGSRGKTSHMFVAKWISNVFVIFGKHRRSSFFASLVINNKPKHLKNPKTKVDWLSRDSEICEKYLRDPYCNKILPISWYQQMFEFMRPKNLYKESNLIKIKKKTPIYIFSGKHDVTNNNGESSKKLLKMYLGLGIKNSRIHLYENGRHEMINEINKNEVYKDILNEIKMVL